MQNYEKYTIKYLRELAKSMGINPSKKTKQELILKIKEEECRQEPFKFKTGTYIF